jgi:hypothetical protein
MDESISKPFGTTGCTKFGEAVTYLARMRIKNWPKDVIVPRSSIPYLGSEFRFKDCTIKEHAFK